MLAKQFLGAVCALTLVGVAAAEKQSLLERHPMTDDSLEQWKLPGRLNEISGLALSPDGRLFAVADERAAIYELDYEDGKVLKVFGFGDPVVRGDFEGIAYLDDRLWLTTSDGEIFAGREGRDGEQVSYQRWETKLGRECEIEGLAEDLRNNALLLACKHLRKHTTQRDVAIFSWSLPDEALMPDSTLTLPVKKTLRAIHTERFNPSGIVVEPGSGHMIIVAARQRAILEIDAEGNFVAAMEFPMAKRHKQAEGVELTRDGRLLVSDEGGKKKARLAVYQPVEGS